MFCEKCGKFNEPGALYCVSCGKQLDNENEETYRAMKNPQNNENETLAKIVTELRNENKQSVSKKGWYIYSLMSVIPFAGVIFFTCKKKDKNVNKSNFAKAGFVINLIMSIMIFIAVGISVFFFTHKYTGNDTVYSETESGTQEKETEQQQTTITASVKNTENIKQTTTAASSSISVSNAYEYNKSTKQLTFEFNGKMYAYPLSSNDISLMGYSYVSNAAGSETTTYDLYMDKNNSTILVSYLTAAGFSSPCTAFGVEIKEGSSFMGLTAKSNYSMVKNIFKNADTENLKEYVTDTQTGIIYYWFGERKISISFDKGYVTSASIE